MRLRLPDLRRPIGVPRIAPPDVEGHITLADGRRLGYAEFGDPEGPLVLWFHGTPGGRRQLAPSGRRAAQQLGLRVVLVERPGVGVSTPHAYGAIADWAADISTVADELGHERFAVVGLSGGGPYALACAALLGDRVVGAGILGGVVPSAGPDACSTGVVNLARTFTWAISAARIPLAMSLWGIIQPIIPLSHFAYRGFSSLMPPGDQEVFDDPEIEAMFIDDISHASATRFGAVVDDARLFGRDWDFRLADVKVPVHWWHGDSDSIVPLDGAEAAILQLPYATLSLRPGESHLGGFAVADEVLLTISHLF